MGGANAVQYTCGAAEGPSWLAQNLPISYALGGTGPQAAWSLAMIGAPALVALRDAIDAARARVPSPGTAAPKGETT